MKEYERHFHVRNRKPTKTYNAWRNMVQRVTNANRPDYNCYGGRGVTVCQRWLSFLNFIEDMGEKPEGLSIDRIDNSEGYSKENCRWATKREQAENTRRTRRITFNGKTMCLKAWAKEAGMNSASLHGRLKRGWTIERALTQPKRKANRECSCK